MRTLPLVAMIALAAPAMAGPFHPDGDAGFAASEAASLDDAPRVTVDTLDKGDSYDVIAANPHTWPVTLTVSLDRARSENARLLPKARQTVTIQPQSKRVVSRVEAIDKSKPFTFSCAYASATGDFTARPDANYLYRLPYPVGDSYPVLQGPGGNFSHGGRIAFDFDMPEGSIICAARGGKVVGVIDHYDGGGADEAHRLRNNQVVIQHNDGTLASYGHIQKNGALVRLGAVVRAGEQIARSGNVGYSSKPHLHFEVHWPRDGNTRSNMPVRFLTEEGPLSELVMGNVYRRPSRAPLDLTPLSWVKPQPLLGLPRPLPDMAERLSARSARQ